MTFNIKILAALLCLCLAIVSMTGCRPDENKRAVSYTKSYQIDLSGIEADYVIADIASETGSLDPEAMLKLPQDEIIDVVEKLINAAYLSFDDSIGNHVDELFSPQAIIFALADLDTLSLGETEDQLKGIIEADSSIEEFKVYVNQDLKPSLAIIELTMSAKYFQADEGQAGLDVSGTFILSPQDGEWKIISYSIEKELKTVPEVNNEN